MVRRPLPISQASIFLLSQSFSGHVVGGVSDTSLKSIDREGLGERRSGPTHTTKQLPMAFYT